MAASKRGSGGGSNTGLIVTLVFFVLATVILGVMTYLGFDGQAEKEKAKVEAEKKAKIFEDERTWYRFQAWLFRRWMGDTSPGIDKATLTGQKSQFDKNLLAVAKDQKDRDDVAKFTKELEKSMPWDAGKDAEPRSTYESRLADKDRKIDQQVAANDKLAKDNADALAERDKARMELEEEKKNFKKTVDDIKVQNDKDRTTDRMTIAKLQEAMNIENANKEKVRVELEGTQKKLTTEESKLKALTFKEREVQKQLKETRDRLEDKTQQLTSIADKTGVNLQAAEAEALDERAKQMLKVWSKPWKIVDIDRKGTNPYINVGSSDGLTSQVTFSVHELGPDGRLKDKPKGTIEVVRVIGPHLAQVRVTSVKDARGDPILKGDRLFNPTWDPNRKRHVALAGMADLGGDGTDNTEDFRRLMDRQNVVLDAWIDTKDEKAPKLNGKGVSSNTDYLIVGDSLEAVNSPRKALPLYTKEFSDIVEKMKTKAVSDGVTVITLRRYLDMIGYRSPKVISSGLR